MNGVILVFIIFLPNISGKLGESIGIRLTAGSLMGRKSGYSDDPDLRR